MKLNAEISNASQHWERQYNHSKVELAKQKEDSLEKSKEASAKHAEKVQKLKKRLQEREDLIIESRKLLEREKNHREMLEQKRLAMRESSTLTDPAMELLESENSALKDQLLQVRSDIAAVLDQYDKEQEFNKQLTSKVEK